MKKNLKKTAVALAIGGIFSANATAAITDIIISEYVENGNYNNKAIELYNAGSESFTFPSDLYIQHNDGSYINNVLNSDGNNVLEGLTIEANSTLVIIHGDAEEELLAATKDKNVVKSGTWDEQGHSSLNFKGSSTVSLVDTTTDTTYDLIGETYTWGDEVTLRRRLLVDGSTPIQKTTYSSFDWEEFESGTFDDLGTATFYEYVEPTIEPSVCDGVTLTTIAEAQGDSDSSPLIATGSFESADSYYFTGIVTAVADYPVKGFYLQELPENVDGDVTTSDGIFVSTSSATDNMVGNTICISSSVSEYYNFTQLETDSWDIVDTSTSVPEATDIEMISADNGSFEATLERYEGMLVNTPTDIDPNTTGDQDMRVTQTFGFNYDSYRNTMTLAYSRPNVNPTQNNVAGSDEAIAADEQNDDYRLIVESADKADNGDIPYYPAFASDPATNYIRIDDSIIGMEGVISYSDGDFYLTVTNELTSSNITHNTDRSSSPDLDTSTEDTNFAVTVATQNLLNLFNSPFGGDANSFGDNRGADSDNEYQKQLAKAVAAITGLDADIVGLMEIENNGFGQNSAIQEFVDAINEQYWDEDPKDSDTAASTTNRYVFVGFDENGDMILDENDALGSDAIATGIIYRPAKVTLDSMKVISMPEQHAPVVVNDSNVVIKDSTGLTLESGDNYQRETMAATFKVNNTGKRLTVAVNHFKSKGSTCWEEWDGVEFGDASVWEDDAPDADLQGSCENLRIAGAVQLGEELEKIGGDRVIVGDLNAYAQEDPLLVLTENPTGKTLMTARDTFIGDKPQFTSDGAAKEITTTYGYINSIGMKDELKGKQSWSYSYNDEIGALDHVLISPSLETRLIDAVDWHINAAESTLYDYNDEYKGDDTEAFYDETPYRSSDHDSAIISLSYQYGEVEDGEPVNLTISSSLLTVPYLIGEGSLAGDVTQISLTSDEDMSDVTLPNITLTQDDQSLAEIEIHGLAAGLYTATMTLTRDDQVLTQFTQVMKFEAVKQDSTTATVAPAAEYDGSGGSLGMAGLLSLLGLGFLRRRKAA